MKLFFYYYFQHFRNLTFPMERFSFECRKTKTKVITLANHNRCKQRANQNSKQIHVTGAKRGKTRASKSRLFLVFFLIGWESGASFANQSRSEGKQNQSKTKAISKLLSVENSSMGYVGRCLVKQLENEPKMFSSGNDPSAHFLTTWNKHLF